MSLELSEYLLKRGISQAVLDKLVESVSKSRGSRVESKCRESRVIVESRE